MKSLDRSSSFNTNKNIFMVGGCRVEGMFYIATARPPVPNPKLGTPLYDRSTTDYERVGSASAACVFLEKDEKTGFCPKNQYDACSFSLSQNWLFVCITKK
jgi:hypothetical protein